MRAALIFLFLASFMTLCFFSCKRQKQRKTTKFLLETLNGQVKELDEIWLCPPADPQSEFNYCFTNTTTFDENGDPIQTIFAGGPSKFTYGWDSSGNKIETRLDFDHAHIYTIAADGHVLKYKVADFDDYTLYKYDNNGDIIESIDHSFYANSRNPDRDGSKYIYSNSPTWHIETRGFLYDNAHHLLEEKITDKQHGNMFYEYKSFDLENNWTKRVTHFRSIIPLNVRRRLGCKLQDSIYVKNDTVTRKITYY